VSGYCDKLLHRRLSIWGLSRTSVCMLFSRPY